MDGGQILLLYIKVWVVLLFLSTAFRKSKVAAENTEQVQKRELASENTGFISIDCGVEEDYVDWKTGIAYKSDKDFISTGNNKVVAPEYLLTPIFFGSMWNTLRIFPEGNKNCYALKPRQGRNQNYYIRAYFYYGNYDSKNQTQRFQLYLGVNYWGTVDLEDSDWSRHTMTHYSVTDTINVCLINTGFGVPFITGLDLRFLNDSPYTSILSRSLQPEKQIDLGGHLIQGSDEVRYKDDVYDRIWKPFNLSNSISISTNIDIQGDDDPYLLPVEVLRTANRPLDGLNSLSYSYTSPYNENFTPEYLVYFHFAEIEQIPRGKVREFTITLNGLKYGPFTLEYLKPLTIRSTESQVQQNQVRFSVDATPRSDLPPILNAFEIFAIRPLPDSPTNQTDVEAIMAIKEAYKIDKVDWQGDPCLPITAWTGLKCNSDNPPRIISLSLSSSNLSGKIATSLLKLTAIQSLDLSNNELTGTVLEAFVQLPNLTSLYLSRNKLTGAVPHALKEKSDKGQLQLSLDGNLDLCLMDTCEKKHRSFPIPVIASIISVMVLLLLSIIAIFWRLKRGSIFRKQMSLKSKNHPFTYAEIVSITNNFQTIIGEGGFGKVYLGNLKDDSQVAVKLLSQSSRQGYKEFLAEVQLLMIVHHRNLVSLIGYCNEDGNMALVYEYMENGNLKEHLLERSTNMLNWRERLQIAVDAAQGLEYLHNGCRPTIVHRDLKSSNILLTKNFQAKIADFGLSKAFATERDSHITTVPAGTPGYVDPEFQVSGNLNKKSDVYSFGILLCELLTGQPAIIKGHDCATHILQWVTPLIERGDIQSIVDPRFQGEFSTDCAWKVLEIALSCVRLTAIQRPDMTVVLVELKECLAMEMPSGMRMRNSIEMSVPSTEMSLSPR